MKHVLTGTAFAALMALSSVASAADLKMSHVRPQDATIDVELRAFSAAVAEATGGDVTININPDSIYTGALGAAEFARRSGIEAEAGQPEAVI